MTIKRLGDCTPPGMDPIIHAGIKEAWGRSNEIAFKKYAGNCIPEPIPLYADIIEDVHANFTEIAQEIYERDLLDGKWTNAFDDIFKHYIFYGKLLEHVYEFCQYHRMPVMIPLDDIGYNITGYAIQNSPQVRVFPEDGYENNHSDMYHTGGK